MAERKSVKADTPKADSKLSAGTYTRPVREEPTLDPKLAEVRDVEAKKLADLPKPERRADPTLDPALEEARQRDEKREVETYAKPAAQANSNK